jgi:hypothetical protein
VSTAPGTAASQTSEITGTLVSASGSHMGSSVYTNSGGFPVTFVSEDHTSATAFTATFQITTAEDFHLSGSVTTSGLLSSSSTAFVRLLGPGAAIVAEIVVDSDPGCVDPETCGTVGPEPIDVSGTLTPGSYTLEAGASGLAQGIHSTSGSFPSGYDGAFDLTFALATPSVPAFPVGAGAVLAAALGGLGGVALRRRARAVTRAGSAAAPSPRS